MNKRKCKVCSSQLENQKSCCSRICSRKLAGRAAGKVNRKRLKGSKLSIETRRKMSLSHLGNKSFLGKHLSLEHKRKLSQALKGRKLSTEVRQKMSLAKKGISFSDEHRKKLSQAKLGKRHSIQHIRKIRASSVEYLMKNKGVTFSRIGRNEKIILDLQEKIDNCKIQRQFWIKDLGYIVDGFCPETNTIYEVYEPWHQKKIEHDQQRQKEIEEFLHCKFTIIKEDHKLVSISTSPAGG